MARVIRNSVFQGDDVDASRTPMPSNMTNLPSPVEVIFTNVPLGSPEQPSLAVNRRGGSTGDLVLRLVTAGSAVIILLMLASLLAVLAHAAMPSIKKFGWGFITSTDWQPNDTLTRVRRDANGKMVRDESGDPISDPVPVSFGALNVIYGTAVSSVIALIFAVPLSLGTAIFLVRVAPDLPRFAGYIVYTGFGFAIFLLTAWLIGMRNPIAFVVGIPLGVASGWALIRFVPNLSASISFLVEFLAAIPSIAFGLWALFVLAPFLQGNNPVPAWLAWTDRTPGIGWFFDTVPREEMYGAENRVGPDGRTTEVVFRGVEPLLKETLGGVPGFQWMFVQEAVVGKNTIQRPIPLVGRDMFSGGLVLAIMIIPIITAIGRDVLRGVPRAQVEGTTALGATWWQSSKEMLKYSRSGLFGAIMLGLARAAGETMAITMVIGNNNQIEPSPFAPAQTMSSLLANEFAEATNELHRASLVEVALILLVMSLAFNVIARYLVVGKQSRSAAAH
jgi:ABC-type phosphate transport system permease subunit